MMNDLPRSVRLALALVVLAEPAKAASPDAQGTRQLLAVVQSETDLAARAQALQQLARVGTAEAVPSLAALLADERLGQYARDVLEGMPDPAAGEALRAALGQLKGNPLIGVVNSLGIRRDEQAVAALARLAAEADGTVAASALLALGRIGNADALRVIERALPHAEDGRRQAAAEACLLAAERDLKDGRPERAGELYAKVREANVSLPLRVAATRGAILAGGGRGVALLIEQLHSPELAMRDVALLTLRELRSPEITPRVVAELERFGPDMQVWLIGALADRGDRAALAALQTRASRQHEHVRVAALSALGRIGDESSLPILVAALTSAHLATVEAARASLVQIQASGADAFLLAALATSDAALRIKLTGVLGERGAVVAAPELMKLAAGPEVGVSQAAFRALGLLARPEELPQLVRLAIAVTDDASKSLADRAIVTTAMKVLEPERRADAVLNAFRQEADPVQKASLVRPLGAIVRSMGGSHDVFFVLRSALADEAQPVREAALKALAAWPDATPAMLLLDLATDDRLPPAERELAFAGGIRMATDVAAGRERSPLNVRVAFAKANGVVHTRSEKLMLVSGLGHLKHPEAIVMLQPYLNDRDVRTEASLALVQIAPALLGARGDELRPLLETIATAEPDESVRRRAAQLLRGGAAQSGKAKGKKAAAASVPPSGPELFNGADLGNWDGDPAVWRVREGTIVGGSLEGNPRNEFLATTRAYRNFVLRLEYKLVGTEGFVNGGVQVRSVRVARPPNEMSGYQADIGAGHSGCLYDESRRKKFLARPADDLIKALEKPEEWNRYEIRCEGPKVEITLNGQRTVSFTEDDPAVPETGLVALQIHGKCKAEIAFRNLELSELP